MRAAPGSVSANQSKDGPLRIGLVGVGHRGYKTHFLNAAGSRGWAVVAVCDASAEVLSAFSEKHPEVPAYSELQRMVHEQQLDFAVVSVPHKHHLDVCSVLADAGVAVLKEKPVSESPDEYAALQRLPTKIGVTFQKRFEPRYLEMQKLLPHIGELVSFRAALTMNLEALDSTWRAADNVGVTDDLGCHMLDVIFWLFGSPDSVTAQNVGSVRRHQTYGGDDACNMVMKFGGARLIGNVHMSRVAHRDEESLVITGTEGTLYLEGREVTMKDPAGSQTFHFTDTSTKQFVVGSMLRGFGDWVRGAAPSFSSSLQNLHGVVALVEAVKRSAASGGMPAAVDAGRPLNEASLQGQHHVWPLLSRESEAAVIKQMHSSLSIYDRSNVYEVFEERWRKMHGLKHALVCSSGTIAILHMFEALDLRPGDEVLCPVYTFFATATPMLQYGAVPVFCDALPDGNLDPAEVLKKATPKTKAVIVTHMWGLPCRMAEVVENAAKINGGIKVLEDCSHAHGAVVDGRPVGTWGDMAAWSLQAKKNLMGGQAGVMATNSSDYYARAVTHGHFNKRAKQEVPRDHPLRKFWLTGLGLNLRAHPLAVALACQQLDQFPKQDACRQRYAAYLRRELGAIPFLTMPAVADPRGGDKHAWYAFVMRFDADAARTHVDGGGLTRDSFVRALEDRGLREVDVPRSTGLLNELPLFTHSHEAVPRFGPRPWHPPQPTSLFPVAQAFFDSAIKLPVWSTPADRPIVEHYVKTFLAVAEEFMGSAAKDVQEKHQSLLDDQIHSIEVRARL